MLTIRPEVLAQFQQVDIDRSVPQVLDNLYLTYPEFIATMDEPTAFEWVRQAIHNAISHGFEHIEDVEGFVEVSVRLGLEFERRSGNEWAMEILSNNEIVPPEKIDRLRQYIEPPLNSGAPGAEASQT